MDIKDINPYLRFVKIINCGPKNEYLKAVDYHFYFMISDQCVLTIEDTDYSLQPGFAVIIPPGTKYKFNASSEFQIVSINFDYTQNFSNHSKEVQPIKADDFQSDSVIEKVYFENFTFLNHSVLAKRMNYLSDTINSLIDEFTYKKQLYQYTASAMFKNVIINIVRSLISDEKGFDTIDLILDYIHKNYAQNINSELLSNLVGYHPYHLNRLMKKATGTTIRQYIISTRIEAARHYLSDTNYQILKISEMCGYNNFCNFSADFKKRIGLTPTEYRLKTQHLL